VEYGAMNVIDILKERGFIEQTTHEKELQEFLNKGPVTCYVGFDPTASSLHVGSLVPIMSLAHMQREGHRPIALIGGGTGLVGDPSGKTEMRKLLAPEVIEKNVHGIKRQLSRFIDFSDNKALLLNNADWLTKLMYVQLLRDVGQHFSINRMIKAESYKIRIESDEGLSFTEFNYMILQAYDFMKLFENYDCRLQMGGSDQWGNIVAGIELIRRKRKEISFGITFPLITTSNGTKMGKTARGAVWLDPEKTTPYEYYQYWVNTDDRDVQRFMALFTFLPIDEVRLVNRLEGADLNYAKIVLAYEATALAHGPDEAKSAYVAAAKMFGARYVPRNILPSSIIHRNHFEFKDISRIADTDHISQKEETYLINESVPHSSMDKAKLKEGIPAFKIFCLVGLAKSNGAARRLIEQGGAYINGKRIESFESLVTEKDIDNMEILLRAGKKRYHKIKVES